MVRKDADCAVSALSYGTEQGSNWEGYVYTDRPVYRPGHTVHFKAILRLRTAGGYDVPAAKPLSVEIQDPEQKPVYRKTLTTSANGTLHDELTLAPGAALGTYSIEIHTGGESNMEGSFDVEEYKKPEYEVRVTPAKPRVLEGDTAQATIEARYYFGEPVSGAKVKYSVYRTRYWFPLFYDPDDEGDQSGDSRRRCRRYRRRPAFRPGRQARSGWQAHHQLSRPRSPTTSSTTATAWKRTSPTMPMRDIMGRGSVLATYGSFVVNVSPDRYFYAPGSTAAFTVQARDYDNNPVRDPRAPGIAPLGPARQVLRKGEGQRGCRYRGGRLGQSATRHSRRGHPTGCASPPARRKAAWWKMSPPSGRPAAASKISTANLRARRCRSSSTRRATAPARPRKCCIMTGKPNTPVYVTMEGRDLHLAQADPLAGFHRRVRGPHHRSRASPASSSPRSSSAPGTCTAA